MQSRFSNADVEAWRDDGFVLIENFFSADEIAPICVDYEQLYGKVASKGDGTALVDKEDGSFGASTPEQFKNIDMLPYAAGPATNLLSLHPQLIAFARALLGVDDVHLYQSHTWAKFTGEADYDQLFHCDFGNHTLTVPSDVPAMRTVDFIVYFTDVTDAHGALHYVPKSQSNKILRDGAIAAPTMAQQHELKAVERSAAAPAGALLAHSIDTFHRGTNLTLENGYRYTMTVGYKAQGNDQIGFHVWQQAAGRDWSKIFDHASPEQLACLGIPKPGDSFWTLRTLKLTHARWPNWQAAPYYEAAGVDPVPNAARA